MDPNDTGTPLLDSLLSKPNDTMSEVDPHPLVSNLLKAAPAQPTPKLGLRSAPVPKVDFRGITESILQKEEQIKQIQQAKVSVGLSPDVFPEEHYKSAVTKFLEEKAKESPYNEPLPIAPAMDELKSKVITPNIIRPLQETVGKGMLEGAVKKGKLLGGSPADEYTTRRSGKWMVTPEEQQKYIDSPEGRAGQEDLEAKHGAKGAAFLQAASEYGGEAPFFIIGGPGTGVLKATTTGVIAGLVMPEAVPSQMAVGGAVLHTAGTALGRVLELLKPATSEAVAGVKSMFAKAPEPSAEAWSKVKRAGSTAEPQSPPKLLGVITKDGIATVAEELAKAPVTPKALPSGPKQLMRTTRPVVSVGTIDAATNKPILKHQFADGRITVEPLTVDSARAAYRKGEGYTVIAKDLAGASMTGAHQQETDALMGVKRFYEGEGTAGLDFSSDPNIKGSIVSGYRKIKAADLDYDGTYHAPAGAEIYSGPKITPVFEGITRLPDEELPGHKTSAGGHVDYSSDGIGQPVDLGEPTEQYAFGGTGKTAQTSDAVTQQRSAYDLAKIGVEIRGAAGPRRYGDGTPEAPVSPDETYGEELQTKPTERPAPDPVPLTQELTNRKAAWKEPLNRTAEGKAIVEAPPTDFQWHRDNLRRRRITEKDLNAAKKKALTGVDDPEDADEFLRIRGTPVIEAPAVYQGAPTLENVDPADVASLSGVMSKVRTLQPDKSGVDKLLGFMVGRHLRGPTDLATMVTSIQAANQLAKTADDLRSTATSIISKDMLSRTSTDLHQFGEGKMSADQFFGRNPELSARARQFSQDMFLEKEAHDAFFRSVGVVPEQLAEAREDGALPLYVARRYWSRLLAPGQWGKKLQAPGMQDVFQKGVQQILSDMLKASPKQLFVKTEGNVRVNHHVPTVSEDEVAMEVTRIINAQDPVAAFKASSVGRPYQALMAKNRSLPEPVLALLGEVKSGTISLPLTIGMQRANRARYTLMDEVAANPEFSSKRPDVKRGLIYQLPDQGAMFNARSLFVSQAIYEALGNGPKITESSHQILHAIQRLVKGHQVVGGLIGPHLNSLMDNIKGGVLAGGLDLTRPLKSGVSAWQAARALIDYAKDPTGRTGFSAIVLDAKKAGADYFGFGHEEINNPASLKFMRDVNLAFPNPKGNIIARTGDLLMRSMKGYQRGLAWLGGGLDWVDRLFRMQSYIALQDKFLADLAKNGPTSALVREGLVPAGSTHQTAANEVRSMKYDLMTKAELNSAQRHVHEMASRLATRRINQSFWNPTFVGTGIDKLRKSAVGVATPYATAVFENWRVNGGIPLRLKQEPDLRWRLLVSSIAAAGASGMAIAMSGVSKKEIEEAEGEMAKGKQTYKPATFPLAWHDDKGRIQFWNATSWSEITRLMQGDPDDPMLNKVLSNLLMSPIQGGLAEAPVRAGFEKAGILSPVRQSATTPSQTGGLALMQYLHSAGAFPTFFKGVADAARRVPELRPIGQSLEDTKISGIQGIGEMIGRPKPWEEALTPLEGGLKAAGMTNAEPVTRGSKDYTSRPNPSRRLADMEANAELGKRGSMQKDIKSVFNKPGPNTGAKSKADSLVEEQKKQIQKYRDAASKRQKE